MSTRTPLEQLESTLRGMSRKGGSQAKAASLISILLEAYSSAEQVTRYADCLASAKGTCVSVGDSSLCDAQCGSVYVLKGAGEVKAWKVGGGAISIVEGPAAFSISSKDFAVEVSGEGYKVRLRNGVFKGSLSEEDLAKEAQLISETVRKLLPQLKSLAQSLSLCARSSGIKC